MNVLLTAAVLIGALALIGVLVGRRARIADDGVAEFRRQLGALSPDASRPVIRPQATTTRTSTNSDDGEPTEDTENDNGS